MGIESMGRDSSNIERLSNIQRGDVAKTGEKGAAQELPSSLKVREELGDRSAVNVSGIKASFDDVKKDFADGSRSDLPNTQDRNSLILGQLVQSKEAVAGAAKTVADAYQNSKEKPSLADLMIAMVGQTVLKSKLDITRE